MQLFSDQGIGIVLLVSLLLLIGLVLARNAPFIIIGRIVSFIFRPITWLLRRMRLLPSVTGMKPSTVGPSAFAILSRAAREQTETEKALGDDFDHEQSHIRQRGSFFQWVQVIVGYIQITETLNEEIENKYFESAEDFFKSKVPVNTDPQSLYEDIEGGISITYFKSSDAGAYFLLNEMQKSINNNVWKLTVTYSALISTVFILNFFIVQGTWIDFTYLFGVAAGSPLFDYATFTVDGDEAAKREYFNQAMFGVFSCFVAALIMWLLYGIEYIPYQRNNSRELNNFVTRYFARLTDHYNRLVAKAKSVTIGNITNPKELATMAQRYHKMILWIAMRSFFIEGFIRNIMFQIRRDTGYYLFFVPLFFGLALYIIWDVAHFIVALMQNDSSYMEQVGSASWIFYVFFGLLILLYMYFLTNSLSSIEEVNQDEWIGFDNLQLEEVLGDVVGKYAEDVGYWKNRVGGRGDVG